MREEALDAGGEGVDGEVDDSLRVGAYFAQPTGTESKIKEFKTCENSGNGTE